MILLTYAPISLPLMWLLWFDDMLLFSLFFISIISPAWLEFSDSLLLYSYFFRHYSSLLTLLTLLKNERDSSGYGYGFLIGS